MIFGQICKCLIRNKQNYSTKNGSSSGKIMKDLNFVNKSLFGSVKSKTIVTSKMMPVSKPSVTINENIDYTSSSDSGIGSEMYWLLKHKKHQTKSKSKVKDLSESKSTLQSTSKLSIPVEAINLPININTIKLTDLLKSFPAYGPSILTDNASFSHILSDVEHNNKWNNKQLPSVSKILQSTMPIAARKALEQWKISKISELGEIGFMELQKSHLMIGSNFHNAIENYFHTQQEPIIDSDDNTSSAVVQLWSSLKKTLTEINRKPFLIEERILHPLLQYRGIVDCVAKFGNELAVIEWKKSDRTKETLSATFDAPLQLCAYLGAINADPKYQSNIGQIKTGLVIVAYTNGTPAHCYRLSEKDVRKYWAQWLKRLHEYWVRSADGTLPEPI